MMKDQIKDDLTYKIIGCAMKVHSTLGNEFPPAAKGLPMVRQEMIYQRCLAIEMEMQGLGFAREEDMPIFYQDVQVGTRRADFIVENQVIVELKALPCRQAGIIKLEDVHLAQGLNYLEAYRIDKGLLLNFGSKSLEVKRLFRKGNPENS